ncbi:MAG: hypothetical protein OEY01_10835 [Desulfobulbaceae bacterium]|nr:hypothetical protein [Desulfobulbaceae bacterium]
MPGWQAPKVIYPKARPGEQRLAGCTAYPTTGRITGAPVEWCRKSRGEWCGKCQWLKF